MIALLAVGLLRFGVHEHFAVEYAMCVSVEDALVQFAACARRRDVLDPGLVIGVLRPVHEIEAVEACFRRLAEQPGVDVRA